MSNPMVPGLRRKPVQVYVREDFVRMEWFIVVNLDELTDTVVRGEPAEGGLTKDEWTDDELGMLVYGPALWNPMTEAQKATNVDKLLDYLEQFEQNEAPIARARFEKKEEDDRKGGFKSRYENAGGKICPTLLWFPEGVSRAAPMLSARYGVLAAARTYEYLFPETDFSVALSSFRSAYIDPVRKANEALAAELAPLREGVERLEFLHQVVSAMLDFAASPGARKKLWTVNKPYIDSPLAYKEGFACNPNPTEISNATALRDVTLPRLTEAVASALEWRTNGVARKGHPGAADLVLARERNDLAMELLEALRTNKIILLLLEEHENVVPTIWNLLEDILVDAFSQLATAPPALEELLASEFTAIARVGVQGDFDTSECKPKGEDAEEILREFDTFVPETELVERATELSKRLTNLRKGVDAFRASGAAFERLWTVATPRMLPVFRTVARSQAYVVRAMVERVLRTMPGTADAKQSVVFLQKYLDFAYSKNPGELNEFLKSVLDRTKRARLVGAAGWAGFKCLLAAASLGLALGKAVKGDVSERKASEAVAVVTALISTGKGAADFVGASIKAAPYIQGRWRTAHESYVRLTTIGGKQAGSTISMIDPVSAVLYFTGAALAYGEANAAYRKAKRRRSDVAKEEEAMDQKREQAILAAVGVGLSLASVAAMTSFPVAGAVLALGALVLDRGIWEDMSSISGLPGPGLIARETYEHLNSERFQDAIQYVPNKGEVLTRMESLRGFVSEPFQEGQGAFWRIGSQYLGTTVTDILRTQYGISPEIATVLAKKG